MSILCYKTFCGTAPHGESMKTRNKPIVILLVVLSLAAVLSGCGKQNGDSAGDTEYTITFVTDGGTQIAPITNIGGVMIVPPADPTKTGCLFVGWYDNAELNGDAVTLPTVMPSKNVTYYARFDPIGSDAAVSRITYEYNLGGVPRNGNVSDTEGNVGDTVTVKDGGGFMPTGYKFVGWTVAPSGTVSLSNGKNDGQFDAGEQITLGDKPLKLYAQWAREYVDARASSADKIYVYAPLVGHGLGAAILVRAGQPDKLGFVADAEETGSGYAEFTFYFDESEGGNVTGRLYDDFTYGISDGVNGTYLRYDYATGGYLPYILAVDGFGFAMYSELVGDYLAVRASGLYEYNEQYGDYTFAYIVPDDASQTVYEAYFSLLFEQPDGTGFDGGFMLQGEESGEFLEYGNGALDDDYYIALNGYGYMRYYAYDGIEEKYILVAEGAYKATDIDGEWRFVNGLYGFKFILNTVNIGGEAYPIYVMFDESMYGEFTCGADTLYLDGYGVALYTAAGEEYVGECTVSDNGLVTLAYIPDGADGVEKLFFNIDRSNNTFKISAEGFAVDGTTLIGYSGSSKVIALPDDIIAVADNALNALYTEVSLTSVTIPAGVTSVGIRAFQNNNTLRRAIFLSETPIEIDFSSENNPFRWPSGSFVIVVPESAVDAYKAAWSDCPYTIMGSVEVTLLPEFEIEDGTLIRYNKQPDTPDALDITLPDEVTRIADGVFRGADYLRSVNLNNVTVIGAGAFENCENLVSVVFTNVEEVGEAAFSGCISLRTSGGVDSDDDTVELPAVTLLDDSAFASCFSLVNVVLGENIVIIGDSAFYQCCVYNDRPALTVWLQASEPPAMGSGIAVGNISFRLRVNDVSVALECYAAADWKNYCRHLYVLSGDEKGRYICGDVVLDLDGRAEYRSSEVWMYAIDGDEITFYIYADETNTVSTVVGGITDDGITFTYNGIELSFVRAGARATYVSDDGKYTLECDPATLLPEAYADDGYVGYADVTFNGVRTQMYIGGYTTKIIYNFLDADGERYDFTISFRGNTLVYAKKLSQRYVRNITADDGSVINLHFTASTIYVYGKINIKVDGETLLPEFSDYGTPATENDGVYTFTRTYKQTVYTIVATVSDDMTTFTYTYTYRSSA